MNDKIALVYKLKDNAFIAVLKEEYRYGGSIIVEADNKEELKAKLNGIVKNDDRWITVKGRPVLVKSNGYFANGPIKGKYIGKNKTAPRKLRKGWNNKKLGKESTLKVGITSNVIESGGAAKKNHKLNKYSLAAQKVYDKARLAEPNISKDLMKISKGLNMKMHGLYYSVKTAESVENKIERKRKLHDTDADCVRNMGDLVRYTQVGKHNDLGKNTIKTVRALKDNGYKVTKLENKYLDPKSSYKGIHIDGMSPSGQKFELQIHSPESMKVKEKIHSIYEKSRNLKLNSPERLELEKEMKYISDTLPMPEEIKSVKNF